MPIDNEEQKEILLGNKQLLSIFFVVVVLLGVSFTIGYTIGKNTATVHASAPTVERPAVAQGESPVSSSAGSLPPSADPAPPVTGSDDALSPAQATAPPTAPATHVAKPYRSEPAPDSTPDADATPAAPEPAAAANANGTYLQVAALKREDADRIAKILRKRGYAAKLGDSSKEGLFRVLVGPFTNMGDVAESKQKLKASGMDSFIVR